jgi:hypothetical protein
VVDALPSLIVALADLSAVRAVTGAINANLPKTGPLGTIPASATLGDPQPRPKLSDEPEARLAPQPVFHPEPRFDPRFVVHPQPRIEEIPPQYVGTDAPASIDQKHSSNPILPPWREPILLPHPQDVVIEPKVIRQTVDLINKGTLLDLFV